jgi:hypothetical protein
LLQIDNSLYFFWRGFGDGLFGMYGFINVEVASSRLSPNPPLRDCPQILPKSSKKDIEEL